MELKYQLMKIRENQWMVPENVDKYQLAVEMMSNIGSTDSEFRDELILELLFKMIAEKELTEKEVKDLMELALSEEHLFYKIGLQEDDSVFNRAFTVLVISGMMYRHNEEKGKLFTEEEVKRICKEVIRYAKEEKDVRGYVENKGWAHSAAHTGDALRELALCKGVDKSELLEMLEGIKEKICISYYTYKNNEDERLISAVVNIIQRAILEEEEVISWIKSFEDIKRTGEFPEDHFLISNQKTLLSALYFRLKRRDGTKPFLDAIEEAINISTPAYFK